MLEHLTWQLTSLVGEHLLDAHATGVGDLLHGAHLGQALDGAAGIVEGVGAADLLAEPVLNTSQLQDCPHRPTCHPDTSSQPCYPSKLPCHCALDELGHVSNLVFIVLNKTTTCKSSPSFAKARMDNPVSRPVSRPGNVPSCMPFPRSTMPASKVHMLAVRRCSMQQNKGFPQGLQLLDRGSTGPKGFCSATGQR